jgi:Helix-turn-helix domain
MTPDQTPLTVAQAAQMSGLSASTLKRRITTQALAARYSATGTWLIERSDLMAFLATSEPTMGSQRTPARLGATSVAGSEQVVIEHLTRSLERERQLNADLQRASEDLRSQNRELQGQLMKFAAEMQAIMSKETDGKLSRWFRR